MTGDAGRLRPAQTVALACQRWGEQQVARRCAELLAAPPGESDRELLAYLAAAPSVTTDRAPSLPLRAGWRDWYPAWAARGLRYAWDPAAAPAVVAALAAPQWRVRELAATVCLARELGQAADRLAELLADPVPRVRIAAARAVAALGEAEHAPPLRRLRTDPDPRCRAQAERALRVLAERLDRPLD